MWVVAVPVYHCYLSNAIALPPLVGKPSGGRASQTYLDPLSKFQASTTRLFFLTNAAVRTLHGFIQCSAANSCLNSELVKFSHSSVPEHLQSSHLRFSLSPLQLPSVHQHGQEDPAPPLHQPGRRDDVHPWSAAHSSSHWARQGI